MLGVPGLRKLARVSHCATTKSMRTTGRSAGDVDAGLSLRS